jgi:hypothetical protein
MEVIVASAHDIGGDVLEVRGSVDGEEVTATGWVSALTNHYDASAYGDDGHLRDGAKPRKMTKAEQLDYCRRLLVGVAPPPRRDLRIKG